MSLAYEIDKGVVTLRNDPSAIGTRRGLQGLTISWNEFHGAWLQNWGIVVVIVSIISNIFYIIAHVLVCTRANSKMIEDLGSQFSNVGNTTLIRAPITLIHHTLDYHSMAVSWFITNNLKKIDKTRENYCLPSGNSSVTGIKKDNLNPAVDRFSREPVPLFGVRHRVNLLRFLQQFSEF